MQLLLSVKIAIYLSLQLQNVREWTWNLFSKNSLKEFDSLGLQTHRNEESNEKLKKKERTSLNY